MGMENVRCVMTVDFWALQCNGKQALLSLMPHSHVYLGLGVSMW